MRRFILKITLSEDDIGDAGEFRGGWETGEYVEFDHKARGLSSRKFNKAARALVDKFRERLITDQTLDGC